MDDEEPGFFDSVVDYVSDTAESVGDFAEGLYDRAEDSFTHSARGIEEDLDTDHDGSLIDNVFEGGVSSFGDVPVVGGLLETVVAPIAEEIGDFGTDLMGTRHEGVFSEEGTYDNTAEGFDTDYTSGSFDGVGQYVNEELGIGENSPTDILQDMGAAAMVMGDPAGAAIYGGLGLAGEAARENEDPYEQ